MTTYLLQLFITTYDNNETFFVFRLLITTIYYIVGMTTMKYRFFRSFVLCTNIGMFVPTFVFTFS
jgi:hypothetical protein